MAKQEAANASNNPIDNMRWFQIDQHSALTKRLLLKLAQENINSEHERTEVEYRTTVERQKKLEAELTGLGRQKRRLESFLSPI